MYATYHLFERMKTHSVVFSFVLLYGSYMYIFNDYKRLKVVSNALYWYFVLHNWLYFFELR